MTETRPFVKGVFMQKKMMAALNTKGKCTSATLKKIMDKLYNREERDEFVGVQIYYFRKHYNSLIRRGM